MWLSLACRTHKLVPAISNASDIHCEGSAGDRLVKQSLKKIDERGMGQSLLEESEMTRAAGVMG